MRDRLGRIFIRQKEFQETVRKRNPETPEGMEFFIEQALAMMVETGEAIQELDWKSWKNGTSDWDKYGGELADIFLFWVNLCIEAGEDSGTMYKRISEKQVENVKRQEEGY